MKFFISFLATFLVSCSIYAQNETIVKGEVIDPKNGEKLSFASVVFTGTSIGTSTDLDGKFIVQTKQKVESVSVSYLGYETQVIPIQLGREQILTVALREDRIFQGPEAIIEATRKPKKDTAAISLFRRVVAAKPVNDVERNLKTYSFENYVKTEFDLFNVDAKKMKENKVLKPFAFVLENADTTKEGKLYLPALLRETISDNYFAQDPKRKKEIIKAEQFSGIKNLSVGELLDFTFDDINIYENLMLISGKNFVSPFADGALSSYNYYLTDSAMIDGAKNYKLSFTPRRKQDLAFTGYAWIDEKTAAIKSLELTILDQINLNFVNDLAVKQTFNYVDGYWVKVKEQMFTSLNVTKSKASGSFRIIKTSSRENIKVNPELAANQFDGDEMSRLDGATDRDKKYWEANRHDTLTTTEGGIYKMVDSVKSTRTYKTYEWLAYFGATAFAKAGPVEFGRWYKFVSWNSIEGVRLRIGGRTNPKFSKNLQFYGYGAYGLKDKEWKYFGGAGYRFPSKKGRWNAMSIEYRYDFSQLNNPDVLLTHDNIIVSLMRKPGTPLSRLMKLRQGMISTDREWFKNFNQQLFFYHKQFYSVPSVFPFTEGDVTNPTPVEKFTTVEFMLGTRWTPGQKFLSGNFARIPVTFSRPQFELNMTFGVKGILGSQFNYQKFDATISQRLPCGALGYNLYRIAAGKVFGRSPYPLMFMHIGNESYIYNKLAFNFMNEFQYVSDEFASVSVEHHFEGLLLNQIPLIKKLKWREVGFFRGLAGRLTNKAKDNMVINLPTTMSSLDGYYAEAGFGIENIFSIFRFDVGWRLTQRNTAQSPTNVGFRVAIQPKF